jgi:alpha-mannosidase
VVKSLAGGLLCLCALGATAQQTTVWQIGKFDDSSREFHDVHGVSYADPASDVDFIVGRSSDQDWMRFQPGDANGLAGARQHPFRIHFTLPAVRSGEYDLKIAVLYETPRLSSLAVKINGHSGVFFFEPRLDYAAGDWEGTFVPQTSRAEKIITIPARWLQTGDNLLTLTAVDSPATPENSVGDIAPGESGLVYDAVALLHQPDGSAAPGTKLNATPTIFFHKTSTGLAEVVRACAQASGKGPVPARIHLQAVGFDAWKDLHFGTAMESGEFGEACAEFDVPAWEGTLHASVDTGGHAVPLMLEAQKRWTILIVPHEHLDIGFTDYREKVAELQSQSIDGVLDMLPAHPDFRWTMDGSWVAEQYFAGRSPERAKQFVAAMQRGQIVLPQQYANQHTGVASLEGLARSLYPSRAISMKYDVPVGAANITDVPSYSWSYASLLHSAGVRYFAAASNSWRAPILLKGRWNEKSPFYWKGPDGGRVLMWYSRAYLQLASMFGTPPQLEAVHDALPVFLQAYARNSYRADSVMMFGSQLENTPLEPGQVTLPERWVAEYAYPRLEFSTVKDALQSIEKQFGGDIPTYRGDFGPYWEDGFTSGAAATSVHRANQQRILSAEKIATIPALIDQSLRPDAGLLHEAWRNSLLFDEHTWTAVSATTQPEGDQNIRQWESKSAQTLVAKDDIEHSVERSWGQMESTLSAKRASLVVFNPLNWTRSEWLETDLSEGEQIMDPDTGKAVPQETMRVETGTPLPGFGGRTLRVRYRADSIPGLGYKLFPVAAAKVVAASSFAEGSHNVLENRFYKVVLDPASGSIKSIFDKELGREVVDGSSAFGFGGYVYVTGADDMPNNSLYRFGATLPQPQLTTHTARASHIEMRRNEFAQTATVTSSAPNTPSISTEIRLPSDVRRIDLRITLHKDATLHREAAYIAFPFAITHPGFAYDIQNGWVDPAKDELAGGSREWYAAQHWVAAHNDTMSVAVIPIDAPMIAFGDIVRGAWPDRFAPASSTIFSWLMSNYWSTNFNSSQGGDFTFRYSIVTSPKFRPEELTRIGWERMTPLEADALPAASGVASASSGSFLTIENPNVVVSTWKLAEDGKGSIVRLVENAGVPETVHLRSDYLYLNHAWRCSLLEQCDQVLPVEKNALTVPMKPFEILTLRLDTSPEKKP